MIYEYLCNNCSDQFETDQRITAKPLKKCKKCGQNSLERLLFPVMGRMACANIGSLGEKNYKKDRNRVMEEKDKNGTLVKEKHNKKIREIIKMSPNEKRKFIEHG